MFSGSNRDIRLLSMDTGSVNWHT